MRLGVIVAAIAAVCVAACPASAAALTLSSVGSQNRHPRATFSAPRASDATIYLATKPALATDGKFLEKNIKVTDFFTDSEIQSGRWMSESQLDPGVYYVMLCVYRDLDSCYLADGNYDPACANGFSNVVTLTIPRPTIRYSATVYTFLNEVRLALAAKPLGEDEGYRVCYRNAAGARRCVTGRLDGYDWNDGTTNSLSVSTRGLPKVTTFTWYVGAKQVAAKRVRVRR